jgi:tetratricopeptide (TPR) repeat protein
VPSQLPLDVPDFSGRAAELERLTELICGHDPVRPPVAVISGAPGTGKTALAVRLGHQVRDAFPDGQIYLDMRSATQPRDSGGALHDLLRSLDVPDTAVPADPDRRSAALRSELASRRVLMILDDVGSAGQVLPLLPGTGASALVITSRSRLTDLPGADSLGLDLLDTAQATELLRRVAGNRQLDNDRDRAATDEIVAACGNLPLAIRIAASRLAQRPDLSAAELARRLRDESQRLDELSIGELAVRTSADLSYRSLGAEEARLYRLIGHLALGEFTASSLDPVGAGTPTGAAIRRSLDRLIEANLVEVSSVTGPEPRYRVHELVRLHAVTAGTSADREQAVRDLTRVLGTALDRVRRAADDLGFEYFGVLDRTATEIAAAEPGPSMTMAAAREWCDAERAGLVSAVRAAAHNGLHDLAWRIAAAWAPYLDLRAGFDDWTESHRIGLASARACGDVRAEAIMLRNLGQIALYRDDWEPAYDQATAAYLLFDKVGDRLGVGVSAVQLGTWHRERGMPDEALENFEAALRAFIDAGDVNGEAVARSAIASIWIRRREPAEALRHLTASFRLAAELGDPHREAKVRRRIAELRESQNRQREAVRQLSTALAIFVRIGDVHCASYTRVALGQAQLALGDDAAARRMFLEALEIGHRLGDRSVEGQAAYQLGLLHRRAGHADPARRYLGRAQRLWKLVANDAAAADATRELASLG